MTQHTPGPWFARMQQSARGENLGWIIEHKNGRIGWASLAYAGTNKGANYDDPTCAANARLIAASPRMFAVIERGAATGDAECVAIVEAVNGSAATGTPT